MAYVPSPYEKDLEKIVRGIRNAHDRLTALAAADITDYAEGSFTPAISFGGGTTGITYTRQVGGYTKIGKLVNVSIFITLSSKGSSTGGANITGLPFTAANVSFLRPFAFLYTDATFTGVPFGILVENTTALVLQSSTGAGAFASITDASCSNTTSFGCTFDYRTT